MKIIDGQVFGDRGDNCIRCSKELKHALVPVPSFSGKARTLRAIESVSVPFNGLTHHFCRAKCARAYFYITLGETL